MSATTAPKVKAASPNQKIALDALKGGRVVKIVQDGTKKKVVLTTATGKAVNGAPKLDRAAVEAGIKNGWIDTNGTLTDAGKLAAKPAKVAKTAK